MNKIIIFLAFFVGQSSFAALDFTSLRVFPGFSSVLTKAEQVEKMKVNCVFRDQSKLVGFIFVDAQNAQKLRANFNYHTATAKHELSMEKGNIKSVDISLGEQVIERDNLGRGPQPWIMIWGDQWQSLSLDFYFWFGKFQMTQKGKVITMTSDTAPFSYIDRPIYDDMPGRCTWIIELK